MACRIFVLKATVDMALAFFALANSNHLPSKHDGVAFEDVDSKVQGKVSDYGRGATYTKNLIVCHAEGCVDGWIDRLVYKVFHLMIQPSTHGHEDLDEATLAKPLQAMTPSINRKQIVSIFPFLSQSSLPPPKTRIQCDSAFSRVDCKRQALGERNVQVSADGQAGLWGLQPGKDSGITPKLEVPEILHKTVEAKALAINLEPGFYGSFAEIGAGTEVSRWFFRVGAAAGTVAKSVSAYDKTISDTMYGAAQRYVTMERLDSMLEYEYLNVLLPLRKDRGLQTSFFTFADTVMTRPFGKKDALCHGWLGLKFQTQPGVEASKVIIHVRLNDETADQQQEAVGIFGVNLIYGCLFNFRDIDTLLGHLLDGLTPGRIYVDYLTFSSPDYVVDQRMLALKMVQLRLAEAVLFQRNEYSGKHEQAIPDDAFYKKQLCVQRGRFFPLSKLHEEMLESAVRQVEANSPDTDRKILQVYELSGPQMPGEPVETFLTRFDMVASMGHAVLISGFFRFFRLSDYLHKFTRDPIYITLGAPSLPLLFDREFYTGLKGGMLEAFGRLFSSDLRLLVFPLMSDGRNGKHFDFDKNDTVVASVDISSDEIALRETLSPTVHPLFDYLLQNGFLRLVDRKFVRDVPMKSSDEVRNLICKKGDWEKFVPRPVASVIEAATRKTWRCSD